MPGLAVIISPAPKAENELAVKRMVSAMQHEAHYISGTYSDEASRVYVGWSVQPGSYCDCLPIKNHNEDLILFFYGEHHGHDADANGGAATDDARSLLAHFEKDGSACLPTLNGWFHGVLLDKRRGRVLVFNDRCGMQRLYFNESDGTYLFASEAKALLKVRKELREFSPRGLADYLTSGAVLENRTLFSKIETLPAASAWTFDHGSASQRVTYFRPEDWENQTPIAEGEVEGALEAMMPKLMARYARSRLPLAVSLTGGYDTRLIMAYLNRQHTTGACYTFGGIYRECFDIKIARQIASKCGYRHHVLALDQPFFSGFSQLAEKTVYISDGNLGACNAYELYLNMRARQIAPVKLTGSFGSEVMRGARAFRAIPPTAGLIRSDFLPHIDESVRSFDATTQGNRISFSVFKHAPWYYYNRLAIEQSQVVVRTPFLDNDLVALMYRVHHYETNRKELARRLISRGNSALATMPTDTGNTSWWKYQLLQFLFQADYCYKSGMPQWLEQLHYTFRHLQPERWFIGRHRFQHFRVWFRKELAGYVREILLDPRTTSRPYFEKSFLEQMVHRHLKGDRNYTDDIERVLTVELAHRTLLETS